MAGMRLSGLMSGMDTESIIQQLVESRKVKVDTTKKTQTKLNWKQDAWKSLNTKLQNLQKKYIANMRFATDYAKKTTKVSNSSVVSVITGENAVNGVQTLEVDQLAKRGYLTGAKIEAKDKKELTALSKLSDIADGIGEGTFSIKSNNKTVDIHVNADTTISDVLTQLRGAGVNANFDAKQQRIFVSSQESGAVNDFSLTASDANGSAALSALGLRVNLNDDAASLKEYKEYAGYYVENDRAATVAKMQGMIDADVASKTNSYLEQYKSLKNSLASNQKSIDELKEKYKDNPLKSVKEYEDEIAATAKAAGELSDEINGMEDGEAKKQKQEELKQLQEKQQELLQQKTDAEKLVSLNESTAELNNQLANVESYVDITEKTESDGSVTYEAAATEKLEKEVEERYYNKAKYAAETMAAHKSDDKTATGATKVSGQDAIIYLNGAMFTNNDNTFEINGLTFTALSETKGEQVTVTTQNDTDGMYDMIKNFLKEYNSIINEMDKLYNADSAKGYEPLTNEEKESMSESDIKEWEAKIKDSLLRRDENLSSVSSALKSIMSAGIEVNGKTMYLSSFGINTLGYFEAPDNEKNAYHIDGDPDDGNTSGNADRLKSMISSDPDTVISFFTQLSKNLYDKMSDMSKSVDGYRSYGNFYDDKKMKSDYSKYTSKIEELEKKLADYEDKWYAKFSAMETALAKMQNNASAVTSLLGG